MIVLAELQPYDPVTDARVTLRACSANDAAVTGLDDERWIPAITDGVIQVGTSRFRGDFDGKTSPSAGALNLLLGKLIIANANARRFNWSAAPVKLYAGNSGDAWPWTQIGELSVDSFTAEANRISLSLKHNEDAFAADVLTVKYAGTGGIEGGADLKNRPKPFLLGRCSNVEPVLIDAVNNIYQFSGYGTIQAVNKLYERGSEYPAALADYADYTALAAATIASGNWATCLASGLIRLGAPAYGVITGDVDGDKAGGTWRRKPGEIMLRLLDNAGVASGLIETASFTGLDTALAAVCTTNLGRMGIYITEQQSVSDVIAMIAAPCNAQAGVSLLGKIFVDRVGIGTPTLTLDAQARQKPRVVRSVEKSVSPPWSFMEFGYDRSWRVHTEDEISLIDPATAGLNSATVFVYKRAASTPTAPLYDTTYTFATGALTGLTGGWTTTIPAADGNPLYTCLAVASSSDATYVIEHMDWSAPSILVNDGDDGTDAKTLTINSGRTFFTFDGTGTLSPGSQSALVSVNPQNFVGGDVVWTYADNLGTASATLAALVTNTSTTSRTIPSTVFTGTPTRTYLSVTATGQGAESAMSATTTVYRQDNGADGTPGADGDPGADGANAKTITVGTDRSDFTFDGASNLSPGSQTAVVTANPQNFVGGAVVWSYTDNLGTSSATLAALVTATSANVRTVPSTVFTGTLTRTWMRVTATGQGAESALSASTTLYRKNDGTSALVVKLSNEAANVSTDADGGNGDYSAATGLLSVWYGGTDVTASATLSEVSETACTGTINTATNSPVGSQPKGYYRVTAMTADVASYVMRAVYNPGSGNITTDKAFSLSRTKRPANMSVTQTRTEITYAPASTPYPASQTNTFTAIKTDSAATVTWTVYDGNGVARTPTSTYLSAATGDSVTMTAAQFEAARNGTDSVLINAVLGSGLVTTGFTVVRKIIATPVLDIILSNPTASITTDDEGNNGVFTGAVGTIKVMYGTEDVTASATLSELSETNCTGDINTATNTPVAGQPKGYYRVTAITGAYALYTMRAVYNPGSGDVTVDKSFYLSRLMRFSTMSVIQDRDEVTYSHTGTLSPSTQTTTFTATKVDSVATVNWKVYDLNGVERTPASSYFSSATGDVVTMTAAQFDSARNGTEGVRVKATLGAAGTSVGLGIVRRVATAPGKSWQVAPNKVTVHTDSAGSPTDAVSNILTATSANTTGVTYVWTLFDGAGTAKTPLATYATMSGTGNSILTITNANMLTAAGSTGQIRVVCTPSDTDLAPITTTITEVGDGANAVSTEIYGTRDRVTRDAWGRIWPSSQTTNLSLTRKNFTGGTVAWTITDGDGNALTPSTYLSSTSGDTTSITAANVSAGAGATRRVIIYATVNSLVTAYPIVLDTVGPIGGNEFPDPQFNAGTTAWVSQPVAPFSFQTNGVTNGYKYENYIRSTSTTTTETYLTISEKIPVRYSGEKFWFGFSGGNVGSGTMPQGAFIRFRNLAGSLVGSTTTLTTTAAITLSSDWPQIISSAVTAPSGAAYVEIGAYRAGIGAITSTLGYSTQFFLQRNEPGADITSTAFPAIAPQLYPASPTVTLPAGWKGDAPTSFKTKFTRVYGGADVSSSSTWSVVQNYGCTVSIASDGTATVTGSSNWEYGNAFFRVKSTYLGVDEFQTVKIMLDMAAPPVPFTDSKLLIGSPAPSTVTATSYASPSVIWGPHTINSMTAGVIAGTLVFQFEADAFGAGSASINIKGQYRAVGGGSWIDMGLNTSKSLGQLNADGTSKATIGASWGVASGLTNNTDYEFRVIAYKTTAGSVAATPKVVYLNSGVQL